MAPDYIASQFLEQPLALFESFLQSVDFEEFRLGWQYSRRDSVPTLLDLIGGWVAFGDGIQACKTYEVYLLAIISVTEQWIVDPQSTWCWTDASGASVPLSGFSTTTPEPEFNTVITHSAINRTYWEMMRVRDQ